MIPNGSLIIKSLATIVPAVNYNCNNLFCHLLFNVRLAASNRSPASPCTRSFIIFMNRKFILQLVLDFYDYTRFALTLCNLHPLASDEMKRRLRRNDGDGREQYWTVVRDCRDSTSINCIQTKNNKNKWSAIEVDGVGCPRRGANTINPNKFIRIYSSTRQMPTVQSIFE